MSRFQLSDVEVAISKIVETAINTPQSVGTNFVGALMSATPPPTPQANLITDDGMVGDGNEWGDDQRLDYWQPATPSIGGQLNTEIAGRLLLRGLGGTVSDAAVTASTSYDHSAAMQSKAQGRTPKLSTLLMALGGADFMWPSMAVNEWQASFSGVDPVQFTAALMNTGFWRDLSVDFPSLAIPAPGAYHYMYPVQTSVIFNDGSVVDYASDGRLLAGSIGFSNGIVVRGLPGDSLLTAGAPRSGAYARDIHRGQRDATASLRVSLDENFAEFTKYKSQADITGLTYLFRGDLIGAGPDYYEVEVRMPRCKIKSVVIEGDGDDAAIAIEFWRRRDTVSGGLLTARVRNDQPTYS